STDQGPPEPLHPLAFELPLFDELLHVNARPGSHRTQPHKMEDPMFGGSHGVDGRNRSGPHDAENAQIADSSPYEQVASQFGMDQGDQHDDARHTQKQTLVDGGQPAEYQRANIQIAALLRRVAPAHEH